MDRRELTSLLASAGLRPQHRFGQNFMVDAATLQRIAEAGQVQPHDVILEVGPGVGNLTRLLSGLVPHGAVLAVDIDRKLLPVAQRHHAALTNVTWLQADVLAGKHELEPAVLDALARLHAQHPGGHLRLVSNLPYNVASPLVANLLVAMWKGSRGGVKGSRGQGVEAEGSRGQGVEGSSIGVTECRGNGVSPDNDQATPTLRHSDTPTLAPDPSTPSAAGPLDPFVFALLAFTVQWEVAQRLAAPPGTADYGPLGILVQLLSDVEIVRKIPPGAFWPPPKVHSALVRVTPNPAKIAAVPDVAALQKLLAGLFSHRRQTIHNALKHHLAEAYTPALIAQLSAAAIDTKLRPENLTPSQYLTLAQLVTI